MRGLLFFIVAVAALGHAEAFAQSCERHPTCTKMRSCAEADFYYRVCGDTERDGDGDGIPCEELCGKTMEQYSERRDQQ
jgi:hypothetical protein